MNDARAAALVTDPLEGTAYRALGVLGQGGMGRVLDAQVRKTGLPVAVKVLNEDIVDDDQLADRMRAEAETLMSIRSPHVVRVFDAGRLPAGSYFVVMERLRGRTLGDELRRHGAIEPKRAIGYAIQLLDGLEEAHRRGLTHRDVKPENLFLCEGAEPRTLKVLDYGLVKIPEQTRGGPQPLALPTAPGLMLGTPRWSAPEQLAARHVDARSDVYSASLCIYAFVTGGSPWRNLKGMEEIVRAQLKRMPPPPSEVMNDPSLRWLDVLLERGYAKKPDDRFESAGELAAVLRQCLELHFKEAHVVLATDRLPIPAQTPRLPRVQSIPDVEVGPVSPKPIPAAEEVSLSPTRIEGVRAKPAPAQAAPPQAARKQGLSVTQQRALLVFVGVLLGLIAILVVAR
jgi:serine/threonine-protein kinase